MSRCLIVASLVAVSCMSVNLSADGAEAPKLIAWSNSKTGDLKTFFQVSPAEEITFSVKADRAEEYQWRINGVTVPGAGGASFKWTVPNKNGMWKVLVRTTNSARRQWVKDRAVLWNKWMSGKEKDKFIRDMIDLNVYPVKAQTEWIVASSLIKVNPGQSIQKAIDSLPTTGGIVELVAGTHEINEAAYPTGSFRWYFPRAKKPRDTRYSILIKRSNVAVCGSRKSIVRHHNKDAICFFTPDLEATDPDLYIKNLTFRGFTTASTYTRKDRSNTGIIMVAHVKNLTVEDIHDTSWAARLAANTCASQSHLRFSSNMTYRNNIIEHSGLQGAFMDNVHILNNTVKGCHRGGTAIYTDRNEKHVHVIGNYARGGANKVFTTDGGSYWEVRDNDFAASQCTMWIQQGASHVIVENNTLTNTRDYAILIYPQGACDDVIIVNNRIYNNTGGGIYTTEYSGARRHGTIRIMNNIIFNNGKDGIRTNTERQTLIVSNNVIANCKGYGINPAKGKIVGKHNNLWNNAKGNYNGCAAGPGDISEDPLFVNPSRGDFHLKSKAGRWDTKAGKWVKDETHSPCIDAGDPKADCSREPAPNGGRVNIGAYGNTKEASKSTSR